MATESVKELSLGSLKGQNVVTGACDDAMVYGLLVWAFSLRDTAAKPFHLVVAYLENRLSLRNKELIRSTLDHLKIAHSFLPLSPDERFLTQGHVSPTTFTKFLISDAITQEHLWIDIDTIALTGWDDLFEMVAKVPATTKLVVAERGRNGNTRADTVVVPSDLAFNAGVLGWPKGKRKEWAATMQSLGDVPTLEQYTFNALYSSSLARVPESFNLLTYRLDQIDSQDLPHIIHYAGAHKPWHLPRRFATQCASYQCPWSLWFRAEASFLESLKGSPVFADVLRAQTRAMTSGRIFWRRDHSGVILLRLLRYLGPLGWLIVWGARALKSQIPQGTHPLH